LSEELFILESCCLRPIIRNSVLEELRVRRFADFCEELCNVRNISLVGNVSGMVGFRCSGGQRWSDSSSPIRTCHDLELLSSGRWTPEPEDALVPGCHCPPDMYIDHRGRCVAARECSCYDESSRKNVPPGRTQRRDCSIWYEQLQTTVTRETMAR